MINCGTTHVDALRLFQADDETEGIVMISEISSSAKLQRLQENVTKPIVAFICGADGTSWRQAHRRNHCWWKGTAGK